MSELSSVSRDSLIVGVETWSCEFQLPRPIQLDELEIRTREYVIVRLTTVAGQQGVAYSLTRGAPLGAVVDRLLAPRLLGQDALEIERLAHTLQRSLLLVGVEGLPQRGLSLVDICLWDIKGKMVETPVWQLLGGDRSEVSVLLVDCYPGPEAQVEDLVSSLALRVDEGYEALKLHFPGDVDLMSALLSALRETLGPEYPLVVDAAMSFEDPLVAAEAIHAWESQRPEWVEDPFRGDEVDLLQSVRARIQTPLGAGDEVASVASMRRLIGSGAVDVVRLDATCQGGISGFRDLLAEARARGLGVSAHTYPEVHLHCALGCPGLPQIEMFASDSDFDCAERFIAPDSRIYPEAGRVQAPDKPGLGLEFDWAAIEASAFEHTVRDDPATEHV